MMAMLVVALVGAAGGYGMALMGWGPIKEDQAHLIALLDEQRKALDATVVDQARAVQALSAAQATLRTERDRREGERLVESATRQGLERNVHARDAELASLRAQIAFYEQLLPSGPPGTVSIRGFTVESVPELLRYRVLLMRSGRPSGDAFEGRLQFVAEGVQDGETRTVNLEPLVVSEPASAEPLQEKDGQAPVQPGTNDTLAVSFVQYQRSQGLLAVPKDFQVRSVTLNVLEGNVVRASRQIEP